MASIAPVHVARARWTRLRGCALTREGGCSEHVWCGGLLLRVPHCTPSYVHERKVACSATMTAGLAVEMPDVELTCATCAGNAPYSVVSDCGCALGATCDE